MINASSGAQYQVKKLAVTLVWTNEICPVSRAQTVFQQDPACCVALANQHYYR